jgi:hypothetical protein
MENSFDLLRNRRFTVAVFWIPAAVLVAIGFANLSQAVRGIFWAAALTVMGVGCLANAARCRRVHCYLTGPFFLAMAAVALLFGLGILHLANAGWNIIAGAVVAGAVLLTWLPEALFGAYWSSSRRR